MSFSSPFLGMFLEPKSIKSKTLAIASKIRLSYYVSLLKLQNS